MSSTHVTSEKIEEYFQQYGWSYSRDSDNTWITGVRTSVSSFRIFVRMTQHWVFFVVNPLVVAPPRKKDRLRFYYHALRCNFDMNFAKLGLDADGDLFMAIEVPTENFVYSHFADALDGLSHHAALIYSDLFNLAHNADMIKGKYDPELQTGTPHLTEKEHRLLDELTDELKDLVQESDNFEDSDFDDDDGDIIIGGRRLVMHDDHGVTKFELENDSKSFDNDDEDFDNPVTQ
ncbi:MAG: YbjN domain-containing protein [Anaerolineae bacterium]|nr:YbjN domain-containing protein [Anaerolineae bacterium]